jgi:glycosyltransferase involved in cell wall biosynthesis
MNIVSYCLWMGQAGFKTSLWCVADSPIHLEGKRLGLEVVKIPRHRKYVPIGASLRLARQLKVHEVDLLWIRDTRDMGLVAWAKGFSMRTVKVLYQQAMQLGISKRDWVHTWRFKKIDCWVAPLEFLRNQVISMTRYPPQRIEVIPLALQPNRFHQSIDLASARQALNLEANWLVMGNVGRLDPLKGQRFLIEALHRLRAEGEDVHLLLVGDPTRLEGAQFMDELKSTVNDLGLNEFVHFRSHRPDVEVAYAACDVFIMASAGETFGMVTIEAMASGCCVLGTNRSGTPELLAQQRGILFEPNDIGDFVRKIQPTLHSPELRLSMGKVAQNYAQTTFSHERVLSRLTSAVHQMLQV